MTLYSEAAYFDRNACQHCADREEHLRLTRIRKALERRSIPRVSMPVDCEDPERFPEIHRAIEHARQLRAV